MKNNLGPETFYLFLQFFEIPDVSNNRLGFALKAGRDKVIFLGTGF